MRLCAFLQGADKSLTRPGRKQTNVSIRMAWISFDALPCRKKLDDSSQTRCCWNRARPWHASELVSFLVGLRTYQHPGMGQSFFLSFFSDNFTGPEWKVLICTYGLWSSGNDPLSLGWCLSTLLRNVIPSSVWSTPEDEFCTGRRNNLTLTLRSAEMWHRVVFCKITRHRTAT